MGYKKSVSVWGGIDIRRKETYAARENANSRARSDNVVLLARDSSVGRLVAVAAHHGHLSILLVGSGPGVDEHSGERVLWGNYQR